MSPKGNDPAGRSEVGRSEVGRNVAKIDALKLARGEPATIVAIRALVRIRSATSPLAFPPDARSDMAHPPSIKPAPLAAPEPS